MLLPPTEQSCTLPPPPPASVYLPPNTCSQKLRGVVDRCVSRCLCGRGLRAALAFSFFSAPGRRDGCAATVTKKEKAGWGVVVAVPKWSRSVQDSSRLPGIHLPFQPAPPILMKTLIIIIFFSLCRACHFDSCRPGHLWRARRTDNERASDTIDGKTNSVIPGIDGVTASTCAQ